MDYEYAFDRYDRRRLIWTIRVICIYIIGMLYEHLGWMLGHVSKPEMILPEYVTVASRVGTGLQYVPQQGRHHQFYPPTPGFLLNLKFPF